jgi:phage terminase small subunit
MADDREDNAKDKLLKPSHEAFAQNYVSNGGNGTKAAENAGFAAGVNGASAAVAASRLLRNVKVRERIKELESASSVSTSEILGTLASHMRGDITDALPDGDEFVERLKVSGVSHLIKKLKVRTRFIPREGKEPEKEVTHELEFYDAQAAARTLGKYKGLEQAARENDADVRRKTDAVLNLIERTYQAAHDAGDPKSREEIASALATKRPDLAPYVPREWIM